MSGSTGGGGGATPISAAALAKKYDILQKKFRNSQEALARARRKLDRSDLEIHYLLDRLAILEHNNEFALVKAGEEPVPVKPAVSSASRKRKRASDSKSSAAHQQKALAAAATAASVTSPSSKPGPPVSDAPCLAIVRGRVCSRNALVGLNYCWHHSPYDMASPWEFCMYRDTQLNGVVTGCKIPIPKHSIAEEPFCSYHGPFMAKQIAKRPRMTEQPNVGAIAHHGQPLQQQQQPQQQQPQQQQHGLPQGVAPGVAPGFQQPSPQQ